MFTYLNAFMRGYNAKPDILVQPAEKHDISSLAEIHAASFKHAWSDGELEKMLGNKNYLCMVAYQTQRCSPKAFAGNHSKTGV